VRLYTIHLILRSHCRSDQINSTKPDRVIREWSTLVETILNMFRIVIEIGKSSDQEVIGY